MNMQDQQPDLNVQKAVTFFKQAAFSRLLSRLRQKYVELGQIGGQVLLEDSSLNERRAIASLLSKPPYRDANFKVRLVDIDKALRQSGFDCTLPDLLNAFFPDQPLVTRPQQRTARAMRQADFRAALLAIATALPEQSRGRLWLLQGLHGQNWLFSRYKNASEEQREQQLDLIRYVVSILDLLPGSGKPERLAIFAQRTSGDPHKLDPDKAAGRLLLLALHDLAKSVERSTFQQDFYAGQEASSSTDQASRSTASNSTSPQDRAQELRLYRDAGLLVDTISSSVAVFNLAGANYFDGTPDRLVQVAGQRVLLLPLRQLLEWQSIFSSSASIYVFENPQVFEEVIAELELKRPLPTLVCVAGWPSMAALTLLDLLVAQSLANNLYYSGDFDLKGLQIAAYLRNRYPGRCHLWRFDVNAYSVALKVGGVPARASELAVLKTLPDVFASLIEAMQEHKQWAYQEGITSLLAADVK